MTARPNAVPPHFLGGRGSPLVLLHGLSMSWRVWQPVLPMLTDRHRTFAPTLLGHIGAVHTARETQLTIDLVADAVCAQLDEIDIEAAHMAGNSLGGWVAIELARRGRALSVTALSPAGAWARARDAWRLKSLVRIGFAASRCSLLEELMARPAVRRHLLRNLAVRADLMTDEQVGTMLEDMVACTSHEAFLVHLSRNGPLRKLDPAPCPIRLAWSSLDRTLPFTRYGRPMAALIPDAEVVMLPGVGHVPMYDNPQLVAKTILDLTELVDATES